MVRVCLGEIQIVGIERYDRLTLHFGQGWPGSPVLIPPLLCIGLLRGDVGYLRIRRGQWKCLCRVEKETVLWGGFKRCVAGLWEFRRVLRWRCWFVVVKLIVLHGVICLWMTLEGYNCEMTAKKDVVYYFDEMIGTYHYAYAHPLKPLRTAMTDEIVRNYGLDKHFDTIVRAP